MYGISNGMFLLWKGNVLADVSKTNEKIFSDWWTDFILKIFRGYFLKSQSKTTLLDPNTAMSFLLVSVV